MLTLGLSHSTLVRAEPTTCLDETPTERVIANLEKLVADKPNDASIHFILARAHSIAYALNSPVIRDCDTGAPKTNALYDNAGNVAAIEGYDRAVNLAPADAFARLGYGWALQQAGRPGEAVAQYRQAIAVAWPRDEELNTRPRPQGVERTQFFPPMGWTRFVTLEAAARVVPTMYCFIPGRAESQIDSLDIRPMNAGRARASTK